MQITEAGLDHGPTRARIIKNALTTNNVDSFKVESFRCLTFVHPATKGGDLTDVMTTLNNIPADGYTAIVDHSGMFATFGPTWALPC